MSKGFEKFFQAHFFLSIRERVIRVKYYVSSQSESNK
jgi:hypothetical protein